MKILISFLFLSFISIAYAEDPMASHALDKVIAIVNNNVITNGEIVRQEEVIKRELEHTQTSAPGDAVLRKQVLEHLIDIELQLQLAKQNNITASEREVKKAMEKIAENNHFTLEQLYQAVSNQGMNANQFKENIRKEIVISKLQQQALGQEIKIDEKEIHAYSRKASQQNAAMKLYHVKNILIRLSEEPTSEEIQGAKAKAEMIVKKLSTGQDFSATAVAESDDAAALQGGDLGWRRLAALPPVFAKSVTHMRVGEVYGPVRTANGFHIIKLIDVKEDDHIAGTAGLIKKHLSLAEIRQLLYRQKFEEAAKTWVQKLRSNAYVKYV